MICSCHTTDDVYTHHWHPTVAYLRRRGYRHHDAEDITADALAILVGRMTTRPPRIMPCAWLRYRKWVVATRFLRKKRVELVGNLDMREGPSSPQDVHLDVRNALILLPTLQSQVVQALYFDGWTYRECAARLGRSREGVRRIEFRALARLAFILQDYRDTPPPASLQEGWGT